MAKAIKQFWYGLDLGKIGSHWYLCRAGARIMAEKNFGILAKGQFIEQLSWLKLHKITGCIIPDFAKGSDVAYGGLLFRKGKHSYTFWLEPVIED